MLSGCMCECYFCVELIFFERCYVELESDLSLKLLHGGRFFRSPLPLCAILSQREDSLQLLDLISSYRDEDSLIQIESPRAEPLIKVLVY